MGGRLGLSLLFTTRKPALSARFRHPDLVSSAGVTAGETQAQGSDAALEIAGATSRPAAQRLLRPRAKLRLPTAAPSRLSAIPRCQATMAATFVPISTPDEWTQLRERSSSGPILLFKHDPYCIVSVVAHRQVAALDHEIPLLDVAADADLSLAVAAETGVQHESPQVILLRDGAAVWSASHGRITTDALTRALTAPS